ncbi:GFA family protein [Dongia soli]|uniref:GFA family protein n=1 Tax=Dongia soli TaxID=600628 RepID=A0ABU5EFG2_9PROT|nr:GFA family protein [Dongia soli]MDY0885091.1 GFA family protein [Dongia soli]
MSEQASAFPQSGGCLCGRIRYRLLAPPIWTGYCHCTSCRRSTGTVGVAYAGFHNRDVEFDKEPATFNSSPGVRRSFCPTCGTPMVYRSTRWPDETHILVGSMDNPEACPPANHFHASEQVSWLRLEDSLPRHN